eukprot:2326461-Amphidinium_carterae.1
MRNNCAPTVVREWGLCKCWLGGGQNFEIQRSRVALSAPRFQWVSRIRESYSALWKMAIRPPRDVYALEEL